MTSRSCCAITAVASFACALSAGAQEKFATLAVEGRSSDNPSIAANGAFVAVAWSASSSNTTDVFLATSRDGGANFSAPVRVNATLGDARVGGEQPPRVALVASKGQVPAIAVVWTTKGPTGTRLLVARSTDGGRTFGTNNVVPGGEGPGNRGWESVAVDSAGRVFVLWLDHRETMAPGAMHHQQAAVAAVAAPASKPDLVEKAGLSQLYISTLGGTGAHGIARGVCYCCKTSLVAAGGGVYAVWRHVFAGNERDIAFAASRDGGKTFSEPVRVSHDHWQFDGCPENGPAIAIDRDRRVHVVWVTPVDGTEGSRLGLFHAVSRDGHTFTPRTRVPTQGPAGHAQVALAPNGSLIIAWDEVAGGTRRTALARAQVDPSGKATFTPLKAPEEGGGAHPVVASTTTGVLVAWVRQADKGNTIAVAHVR